MASSVVIRSSEWVRDLLRERSNIHGRTQVDELDRLVEAGRAVLEKAEQTPPKRPRKRS